MLSEHPTNNARRLRIAVIAFALSLLGLAAGVPLTISYFVTPWGSATEDPRYGAGSTILPVALLVIGVTGLIVGSVLMSKALRSKDEHFTLYENGIIYRLGDAVLTIALSDIISVEQRGIRKVSVIPRLPGVEYRCVLRLRNGRRLGFDTYTIDAFALADRLEAAVKSSA